MKNNCRKKDHFAPIFQRVFYHPEWKSLSASAKMIYLYIKLGYTGQNNGDIALPYSKMRDMYSSSTMSKSLKELIDAGWIEKTFSGGLMRNSNRYRLTLKIDRVFKG